MDGSGSDRGRHVPASSPLGAIRVQPTQQGIVYIWTIAIFSGVLWWQGENLVFLLGTLALGCGAVAWFLARGNLRRLSFVRETALRTQAGVPTTLSWTVSTEGRRPAVGVEIEDRPARGIRPACLQLDVPVVPVDAPVRCETQVVFGRRGRLDLGGQALQVSSRYPLGLFLASSRVFLRGSILVRAREGRVTPALRTFLRGRAHADALRSRLWQGDDVIYGVREYREGDDPRRIHWRSTARRGTTVISEWRAEHGDETVLVLGRSLGAGQPAAAAFERAVSTAATAWRDCARQNLRARLVLGAGREYQLGPSGRGLEAGLDALALASPRGRRNPRAVLRRWGARPDARRTVLYIGTGQEPGIDAECKAAAGRGGSHMQIRADLRSLLRWVRGVAR